jgi:hypothetical protein
MLRTRNWALFLSILPLCLACERAEETEPSARETESEQVQGADAPEVDSGIGDESEPFSAFISRFCGDDAFRFDRTTWPLETSYVAEGAEGEPPYVSRERTVEREDFRGYPYFEGVDCERDVADWNFGYQIFDLFENFEADTAAASTDDQRALRFRSDDSGLEVHYYFERRDDLWRMVRLEDDTI